ncbi:MAG: hypothetical protein ACTSWP_09480 [Candidatus Freyarchaeota archaeon]
MGNPGYEQLEKEAERNFEVGRFLSAAREFQALSLIAEREKEARAAGRFAAKSGDCWLKLGNHFNAAAMYERAAECYSLTGDIGLRRKYLKIALSELLLAAKKHELEVSKRVEVLIRAANCSRSLGDQKVAERLLLKACKEAISTAEKERERVKPEKAAKYYLLAAKCYSEMNDRKNAARMRLFAIECINQFLQHREKYPEETTEVEDVLKELFEKMG